MAIKGIYKIENKINGKFYIGSSRSITGRWNTHINQLNAQTHHCHTLQTDWIKYNINDFSFSIVEVVYSDKELKDREQFWIDFYKDINEIYNVMLNTKYTNKLSVSESFIDTFTYIETLDDELKCKLKLNIHIHNKKYKLKSVGYEYYDLSKTWFVKNNSEINKLKSSMQNYFKNIMKSKSNESAWTTFTQYYHQIAMNGYRKSFVPINGEIIGEDYNKRNNLCFIANCFPNSFMKNKSDVKVDDDKYALTILIKWIISVSDVNKPINIFIPSQRMEDLLRGWINE